MEKSGNPQNTPKSIAVGRIVMNAIRNLQGTKGISLPNLKKFLRDAKKMDVGLHDAEIKFSLKKNIDRGILLREDGNYKLKEAKRRRSKSKGGKSKKRKGRSKSKSKSKGKKGGRKSGKSKKKSKSKKKRSKRGAAAAAEC